MFHDNFIGIFTPQLAWVRSSKCLVVLLLRNFKSLLQYYPFIRLWCRKWASTTAQTHTPPYEVNIWNSGKRICSFYFSLIRDILLGGVYSFTQVSRILSVNQYFERLSYQQSVGKKKEMKNTLIILLIIGGPFKIWNFNFL